MTFDKDNMGVLASCLCVVHCLSGPLLVALGFTASGFLFFNEETIHLMLIVPIIFFAAWSIPNGFKIHHHLTPLVLAAVGIILLLMALMVHEWEIVLTFLASIMLMAAHLYNKRLLKKLAAIK